MSPTLIVRIIGATILLGTIGFTIHTYMNANSIKRNLIEQHSEDLFNDGEAYLIDDTTDLHLHDSYYIVLSPLGIFLFTTMAIISIGCLIAPKRIVAIFQRQSNQK